MSSEASLFYAYHTASPEVVHSPVHGGIAAYAKIPNFTGTFIGTLSGVVIDKKTKKKLLLSNQHVFFPYQSKSPEVKPGLLIYNSADPTKAIGKSLITKGESNPWPAAKKQEALDKIGTYHDSALATPLVPVSMTVNNIGVQKKPVEPKKGMRIKFYGRKSKLQRGTINNPNVTEIADVGNGKISVRKNVIHADMNSQPGDSGSMVFTEDNHVVGLLYGTSGGFTTICKASAIANAYNVAFSEEEVGGKLPDEKEEEEMKEDIPFEVPPLVLPKLSLDLTDKSTIGLLVLGGIATAILIGGYLVTRK